MKEWSLTLLKLKLWLNGLYVILALAGYYIKVVKGYGAIAKSLNDMLKKDNFMGTQDAKLAFQKLKDLLSNTHVLALLDFSKVFVVEVDASGGGIGAVLTHARFPPYSLHQ